jgi:predicted anti-sigma-YlaC factor YlaD
MLTCQQLTELVSDHIEGRMSLWRSVQFHMHLGMCRHCRAYLRQMRATVRAVGAMPQEPMPDDLKAELLQRLRRMPPAGGR